MAKKNMRDSSPQRTEESYIRYLKRHKANFQSSIYDEEVQEYTCPVCLTLDEICIAREEAEQLHIALAALPCKQRRHVYLHHALGYSQAEIARTEGIGRSAVSLSVKEGMKKLHFLLQGAKHLP